MRPITHNPGERPGMMNVSDGVGVGEADGCYLATSKRGQKREATTGTILRLETTQTRP